MTLPLSTQSCSVDGPPFSGCSLRTGSALLSWSRGSWWGCGRAEAGSLQTSYLRSWMVRPSAPQPMAEVARNHVPQVWAPTSCAVSVLFLPAPLLAAGDPERTNHLLKDGVLWWGSVPSPLPRTRGRGFQQRNSQKPSLYFSFLPFNQFAQAEDGWILERKEHRGTDPPGNSLCTLLRLVRLEKQFNNKLYRIRNV